MLALCLLPLLAAADAAEFSDVKIDKPFDGYLRANSLLMEIPGAKILRLKDGKHVVLAVASTVLADDSANERLRAEKVCRTKALASVVAEKQGVQIAQVETLKEKTVITIEDGKEKGKSVSELLQMTTARVQGMTKDMPVVGRWKSKDGKTFYLAIGTLLDAKGEPIRERAPE